MELAEQREHLDDAEIAERLIAFLEISGSDPRASVRQSERRAYFRRVQLILIAQAGQPHVMGYTRNLSTGGVGFLTRRGFTVGERFAVLLTLGGGSGKYALCRTTFCRYLSDGMCEVGAAFEATAPRLNGNHQIPPDWVAKAHNRATPTR